MMTDQRQARSNDNEYEDVNVWVGGTSGLCQTFFVNYDIIVGSGGNSGKDDDCLPEKWILTGIEQEPPSWMIPFMMTTNNDHKDKENKSDSTEDIKVKQSAPSASSPSVVLEYAWLDLTVVTEEIAREFVTTFLRQRKRKRIVNVVVGIRPKLFDKYIFTSNPRKIVTGLQYLLREIMMVASATKQSDDEKHPLPFILHLSSVAAVDHLTSQHFVKEEDYDGDTPNNGGSGGGRRNLPPLSTYRAPYDRFKRESEDIIAQICQQASIGARSSYPSSSLYCHLRLSAIFSDDEGCIQCNALSLQAYSGVEMPLAIDCNSSLNVAKAIYFLLMVAMVEKQASKTSSSSAKMVIDHIYYYTRPLGLHKPVEYGYYLREYRKAYGISKADDSSTDNNNHVGEVDRRTGSCSSCLSSKIFPISIPVWLVVGFTQFVHILSIWNRQIVSLFGRRRLKKWKSDPNQNKNDGDDKTGMLDGISQWREEDDLLLWKGIPYLDSIDYLLQVASREHSFDCRRFQKFVDVTAKTYPLLGATFQEESIYDCFVRRKKYLDDQRKLMSKKRLDHLKQRRKLEYERLRKRTMPSH